MSLPALVQQTACTRSFYSLRLAAVRGYASPSSNSSNQPAKVASSESTKNAVSSCPAGTVMTGLNFLKGEPPVLAKPDEEYPTWLWDLTKPKRAFAEHGDGGEPGGKAEKRRLRLQHRQALKDSNLFKSK